MSAGAADEARRKTEASEFLFLAHRSMDAVGRNAPCTNPATHRRLLCPGSDASILGFRSRRFELRVGPAVGVLESDDIILAEVAPRLYLDNLQGR